MLKLAFGIASIIGCTIGANLLLKIGASLPDRDRMLFGVLNWHSFAGLCLFAAAGVMYAWVLKWLPLHIAQGIAAAQFMGVILASWLVLSEPISGAQWIGIALIAAGIVVTGVAYRPA
jgi:drug/metabolite transporter (DMT)-like permease